MAREMQQDGIEPLVSTGEDGVVFGSGPEALHFEKKRRRESSLALLQTTPCRVVPRDMKRTSKSLCLALAGSGA